MAQRVQILLEDDLDGSEATETVNFALDGKAYEIDLSAANSAQLRDDLAKWIGHARPVVSALLPAAPRPVAPTSTRSANGAARTASRSATVVACPPRSRRPTRAPTPDRRPAAGNRIGVPAAHRAPLVM